MDPVSEVAAAATIFGVTDELIVGLERSVGLEEEDWEPPVHPATRKMPGMCWRGQEWATEGRWLLVEMTTAGKRVNNLDLSQRSVRTWQQ